MSVGTTGATGTPGATRRFELGTVMATPGARDLIHHGRVDHRALLRRHVRGDWGEVPPEDAEENEFSVREGFRIISSYPVGGEAGEPDGKVWVITEADRSATTFLLPDEY